jgi:hypothetical protein
MVLLKAISNWNWIRQAGGTEVRSQRGAVRQSVAWLMRALVLVFVAFCWSVSAAPKFDVPGPSLAPEFGQAARENLGLAKAAYAKDSESTTNAWKLARAYFVVGEFATNKTERAQIANGGIAIAAQLTEREPESAEGWYYYGLNSGQLARTKMLGALPIVREMEKYFTRANALNPRLDHAGAHRCLALLYRDAPGWPFSIGSGRKARAHLEQASKLAPAYPENALIRLESRIKWRDRDGLKKNLKDYDAIRTKAQKTLVGEEWGAYWQDWEKRWQKIQDRGKSLLGDQVR